MPRFVEQLRTNENVEIRKHFYNPECGIINCAMYYSKNAKDPVCYYNSKKFHHSKNLLVKSRKLDYCAIFVFFEGNFGFVFEDIAYHPAPGDIFVVRNNVEFSSFFSESSYIDYYEVSFPMDFFENYPENSMFHRLFFNDAEIGAKFISTNKIAANEILQKFNEIDKIINSNNIDSDILSFSYITQIIAIICSQASNNLENIHTEKVPPKLKIALNYIHENFTAPITIADVSNYCNLTNTYLARIFKRVYMETPHEYITKLRITYAKTLLRNGQTLSDACYNSGFSDYNHFITKFKAVTGTTPSKYKKSKS